MKAVFTYAVDNELLMVSPAKGLRLPSVELVDRPELSADDLDRLAKALGSDHAPIMWLGAATGLRWSECAGLTIGTSTWPIVRCASSCNSAATANWRR
jgi:integrase